MSTRIRLGRTGLTVSPICFGTWQLSPRFWGEQSQEAIVEAVHRACDLGVTFFDTADAYGDGLSETVLGKALADLPREEVTLATKVYHHVYPDGRRHGDLSPGYIVQACDASLRRLKTTWIDLYQCHSFDPLTPPDAVVDAMERLVYQGKIRAYGTSNWQIEQLRLGANAGNFSSCQPRYSLLDRGAEADVLPYCQAHDVGVLVYSPLAHGVLTGKFRGDETFTDLRAGEARYQGDRFAALCDRVRQAGALARDHGLTTTQLVLAATLMHPAIHCAIVGIRHPDQIEEAAGAIGRTIPRPHWFQLRELLRD